MKVKDQKIDEEKLKQANNLAKGLMQNMNEKEVILFERYIRSYVDLRLIDV